MTLERQMTSTLLPDCAIKLPAAEAELPPDVWLDVNVVEVDQAVLGAQARPPEWRSGGRSAHLQRRAAFRETDTAPESPVRAVARSHLHPAGRAGGRRPVAFRREVEQLPTQGLGQALKHGEEQSAVEQGDPVLGGEGAGLVGEAVRRHEEGLVDALVRHHAPQFPHRLYADGLVPGLALDDGRSTLGVGGVLEQADVDAAVGAEPGGFGADAFDPIELAAQVFETLPLDAVDELA